jgi:hydrogenase maturation protease
MKPVLVLAIGNESRGDDALGPLLARHIASWQDCHDEVEVIEEFQLQIENTLDMQGRDLVLFLDAGHQTRAPFHFYEAQPKKLAGHTTHAVAPETLLGIYAEVHHAAPPLAFVLCVAGLAFELGESLSPQAMVHLEAASGFCRQLLARLELQAWQAFIPDPFSPIQ